MDHGVLDVFAMLPGWGPAVAGVPAGVLVIAAVVGVRRRRRVGRVREAHARGVEDLARLLLRVQYDYPRPSIAEVIQASRKGGLTVRLHVAGAPCALPDPIDLAAMRIVHEALVNVYRHGTASATVTLSYRGDRVTITVDSRLNARGESRGERQGVAAMRRRAERVGGTVSAGPYEGGWRVHADLPLGVEAAFR